MTPQSANQERALDVFNITGPAVVQKNTQFAFRDERKWPTDHNVRTSEIAIAVEGDAIYKRTGIGQAKYFLIAEIAVRFDPLHEARAEIRY